MAQCKLAGHVRSRVHAHNCSQLEATLHAQMLVGGGWAAGQDKVCHGLLLMSMQHAHLSPADQAAKLNSQKRMLVSP